jgi:hypothetical protein
MEHKFEYDGIEYTWRRGTIRDKQVQIIINSKILKACGWDGDADIPEVDNRGVYIYTDALAHLNPVAVAWWRDAGDTPDALVEGYQDFMMADEELYKLFEKAAGAIAEQKKIAAKSSKT